MLIKLTDKFIYKWILNPHNMWITENVSLFNKSEQNKKLDLQIQLNFMYYYLKRYIIKCLKFNFRNKFGTWDKKLIERTKSSVTQNDGLNTKICSDWQCLQLKIRMPFLKFELLRKSNFRKSGKTSVCVSYFSL